MLILFSKNTTNNKNETIFLAIVFVYLLVYVDSPHLQCSMQKTKFCKFTGKIIRKNTNLYARKILSRITFASTDKFIHLKKSTLFIGKLVIILWLWSRSFVFLLRQYRSTLYEYHFILTGESDHYLEKLARVRLILVHKYVHLNWEWYVKFLLVHMAQTSIIDGFNLDCNNLNTVSNIIILSL